MVEAVRNVAHLVERTSTKWENRACEPGMYAVSLDPFGVPDAEKCKKGITVSGSRNLSKKEEKIVNSRSWLNCVEWSCQIQTGL